jgi:cold shock protein
MTSPGRLGGPRGATHSFADARAASDAIEATRRAQAVRTVAGNSLDAVDCRELLSMLGLDISRTLADRVGAPEVRRRTTRGTVSWFSGVKGFGFVTPADGGPDVFVHCSDIKDYDYRGLADNQLVEFELGEGRNGQQAVSVRVI